MHRGTLIVTGASRGMGAAIARLSAIGGYSVVVNYFRDETAARSVVQSIEAGGGPACAVQADIGLEQDILRLFETAERTFGPVTALVNNAGIVDRVCRVQDVTADELDRMLAVNVRGTILCSREAVRRMSTRRGGSGGGIVNISSIAARLGSAGEWAHYAASKGAVDSFTRGLAREVATEGIRVNAVAPGLVDTEFHATVGAPDRVARMSPGIPMQRAGTPEEIAEAVVWLLSPSASYVTGAILEVGGGR